MIKEQCEQCKRNNTDCQENIEFNGLSCEQYAKRINLEKSEKNETPDDSNVIQQNQETSATIEYPDPNYSIHGWLTLFLFSIGLGGLISALYPIFTYNIAEYDGNHFLAISDVVLGVMLLILACYTIYSFCKRKPNAVFLAKMYVVVTFITNILALISGEFEETGLGSLPRIVRSLVWGVIWFSYLTYSEQVKDIIPKSYRKVFSRDYYLMTAFIIIPILCLAIGVGNIFSQREEQEQNFISTTDLDYNEYTDGRIIFTKPDGFTCEKQELDDPKITVFDLESEYSYLRIVSDYDSDVSVQNFNTYWNGWKDDDLKDYSYKEITNEKREINGNPYFIKSVKYDTETPIIWHFILLFSPKTGKVCVIHSIQIQDETLDIIDFIRTIRF